MGTKRETRLADTWVNEITKKLFLKDYFQWINLIYDLKTE